MVECRDFFEELTSATPRSSSLVNKPSSSEGMPELDEHCLELTLGPGPASCPLQVRPASVYNCLPKQPSGKFASSASLVPASVLSQTSPSLKDSPKGFQSFSGEAEASGLVNQRSSDFILAGSYPLASVGQQADVAKSLLPSGDTAFPSRDQIWLKLQRNGAVFGQDVQDRHEASSMWNRRSASMHVLIPHKDVCDAKNDQIRRSSSSGVFPLRASRQISSIESSFKMSPQKSIVFSQEHNQEALEDLRKRKELQAERRQVARKRRRIATEEKQHKKSKQSSILPGLGNRQSMSSNDKLSLGGTHTGEGLLQESHCASPEALEIEVQNISVQVSQNSHVEESKQETLPQCTKEDKLDTLAGSVDGVEGSSHYMPSESRVSIHGYNATCDGAPNQLSHEYKSGSLSSMMSTEFEQSVSVGNKFLNASNELSYGGSLNNEHAVVATSGCAGAHMNEDEGGKSSECSESTGIQNNSKLLEYTPERGVMGSSALSTAPLPNTPLSYPPFPFLAVPYPYSIAGATSTTIPVQSGFPLPFLVQYSSHSDHMISPLHGTVPIVSGVSPGISLQGTLMSKASSGSKDCARESLEGKGGCGEKSAFTPLSRTASNLKLVKEGPQCSGGQLESQATFSASQLSSISSIGSDVCNTKTLLLERQQSVAFAGRLSSQSSNIQDQFTLGSKQEAITQRGTDLQHEAPILRGNSKAEVKQAEGIKVEGVVESQLGSEHPGTDAAYMQSGIVERQKSGSFLDLPLVTTTGKGPNGKTINGVLYIVDRRHVRLVCSCHGKHMSPAEFVEHSGSTDLSNPERSIVVSPVPSVNHHTASAAV